MPLDTLGSNRDQLLGLAIADRDKLIAQQVLVGDSRRWRPRWFDGRFLAASDLQAEQNYFLVRQADLGRADGSGVVDGLLVSAVAGSEQLRIAPGAGVTDTGELIVLPEGLIVDPANVPEIQRLDAAFGLQVIPNEPGRNRTGLYVLALRLVEWTANPLGAYPTSLTGRRTVEDGTIVEGVAVSLIPYPDTGHEESWSRRRARVAREIFAEGRDRGLDSGVLPLALVALRGNFVEWVDSFMVRRETGAERPVGMDFGFGARALREAHLLQYQQHLADSLDSSGDQPFAASSYFDALPPVGQFPSVTLDADRLTQRFFPAGIDVALSFVPEDELPALIEESLLLPPLDLTDSLQDLDGTGVIVLVPLSRTAFTQSLASLPDFDAQLPELRPAFVQIKALATPKQLLLAQQFRPVVAAPAPAPGELAWRQLLRDGLKNRLLWYIRRRDLPLPSNIAGAPVIAAGATDSDPAGLADLVKADAVLSERLNRIRQLNSPEANLLLQRLAAPGLLQRPALIKSLLANAAGSAGAALRVDEVVAKLAPAADPQLGAGLAAIEAANAKLGTQLASDLVAQTGVLPEIDKIARTLAPGKLPLFIVDLKLAVATPIGLRAKIPELQAKYLPPSP